MMRRCGIYIRVSTEEQARIVDGSLVSQKNRLIEYVEHQKKLHPNWGSIIDFYCDEGRSAKDMNRPEFRRMLADVQSGRINLLIATELSRLSRNIRDFCDIWDLLKKHSSSFITLRESFDTTTASGEMMVFNLINYAQYERKQTAERISANWLSRSKRGLWNGGSIPLGFDRNPKNKGELLVNEDEAKTVQKIFEIFLEEGSVRKTQIKLIEGGIFNKRYTNKHGLEKGGNIFTVDTLQSLLTTKAYIAKRDVLHRDGSRDEVPANWKAIVSEEIFSKVQERLHKNKNKYKPDEWKSHAFPLTEMVQCGECGKSLGGKSGTGRIQKHFYYGQAQIKNPLATHLKPKCQIKNVRAPRLEEIVLNSLKQLLLEPGLIEKWIRIYKEKTVSDLPEVQSRQKQMDTEIQTTGKRITNLVQRVADLPAELSADVFYDQIKQMNQKLLDLRQAKEKLRSQSTDLLAQEIDGKGLAQRIKAAIEKLESSPAEKQRPIYANLVKFVEIHPTKIKLGLYAPSNEQYKATGTDGAPSAGNQTQNLKENKKEATVHPLSPNHRAGSSTVGNGARGGT
ncbi:MAG: recombinase family protein, partial [Bdellovibrionaceae bacterium]|nr:recombinase family protein [Pseudobdellovibrionaceae bacterium]